LTPEAASSRSPGAAAEDRFEASQTPRTGGKERGLDKIMMAWLDG